MSQTKLVQTNTPANRKRAKKKEKQDCSENETFRDLFKDSFVLWFQIIPHESCCKNVKRAVIRKKKSKSQE